MDFKKVFFKDCLPTTMLSRGYVSVRGGLVVFVFTKWADVRRTKWWQK